MIENARIIRLNVDAEEERCNFKSYNISPNIQRKCLGGNFGNQFLLLHLDTIETYYFDVINDLATIYITLNAGIINLKTSKDFADKLINFLDKKLGIVTLEEAGLV